MDPVRSAGLGHEEAAAGNTDAGAEARRSDTRVSGRAAGRVHGRLYNTVGRQWVVDLTGLQKLADRVLSAVEFFLRGIGA